MAAPQSKISSSCSPSPSKPTNPRNSEISNPMRRSFTGNPFPKPSIIPNQRHGFNPNTPANSPSDHPRRNSIGRENVIVSSRDYEDKENSKDQKPKLCIVRSPASSKSTKNFMSPTISAASKINPSPKKKILTERNEHVRQSVYLSKENEPSKENSEFKPEKGLNQKKEVSFSPTITYLEDKEEEVKNSYYSDFDSFSAVENDIVNLDPSFEISPRSSIPLPSPALAPLDADPLLPPYDLNTNYTSPRPRFLHYKPKPLVELYLKQRNEKQLEESFSFASESSSDAEITEQETLSEESSSDSLKDSEDAALSEVMTEEEAEDSKDSKEELFVSEPNPITPFEGAGKGQKRTLVTRPKFTALLFVLALAGLWASVSNSPIMDPSVLNNLNFPNLYVPPEISEFTRENLEGLAQKFRQWLYDSLSYIHNLVIGFREWRNPSRLQFANLTILLEESTVESYLLVDDSAFIAEKGQPIEADVEVEQGREIQQPFQTEDEEIIEGDEFVEEAVEVIDGKIEKSECNEEAIVLPESFEVPGIVTAPEFEEESITVQDDEVSLPSNSATKHSNLATEVTKESVDTEEITELAIAMANAAEIEPEVSSLHQPLAENAINPVETESTMPDFDPESFESETIATMEQPIAGSVDLLSRQAMMGISLLTVISLIVVVPFIYMKNRTSVELNAANREPITEKADHSPSRSFSRNWQEEVETACPSEMSSFFNSSSYSKQERGTTSEAQSRDKEKSRSRSKNSRRESMASSDCSMGSASASYGSFTTYEKVQIKLGKGEEEFLTPVRRSSRINKQVTSP